MRLALPTFLTKLFTRAKRVAARRPIRATYDAAQTGRDNRNHWAAADDLGPVTANSYAVRCTIRQRARYERDNNPHLYAAVKTYSNNLVGTGPRLQLNLDEGQYEAGRLLEKSFAAWARAVNLAEKLRLMAEAKVVDGESFALFVVNPSVRNAVKLDLRVVEAEQVTTPDVAALYFGAETDGIEFDADGSPSFYHVLREHPGDGYVVGAEYDRVAARYVLHWFRPTRPGQTRGVCELASSLGVGAQTRRYSQAVLAKAEVAANIAGVMETDTVTDTGAAAEPRFEDMEEVDIPRGAMLTLPAGFKAKLFDQGTTTTGFGEYVNVQHTTLGRPFLMPSNLVSGDSSRFNFASGKLDHLPFQQSIWVERDVQVRPLVMDRVFVAFYEIAMGLGLVPEELPAINELSWDWQWDGFPSINPEKDAATNRTELEDGTTTLAEVLAGKGFHWREVLDQTAKEMAHCKKLGIPHPLMRMAAAMMPPARPPGRDPVEEQEAVDE